MKSTRVFLSVQTVPYRRSSGTDPFTYRETRPLRYRASWWTRGTSTELYVSKVASSQDEAVRLARQWLVRENKDGPRLIDTTDHPERFGYSHEAPVVHATKRSGRQLDTEVADGDLAAVLARNPGATEASVRSYLRGAHGDSNAIGRAIAAGTAVVVGHKIYRKKDLP